MTNNEFAAWLEGKFVSWMGKTGKRRTLSEFAEYLGVSQPLLSQWLNGKYLPNKENVARLADRLGTEIYLLVGLQHLDPEVQNLINLYLQMGESQKKEMLAFAEKIMARSSNRK